jgi:hypothetical protein
MAKTVEKRSPTLADLFITHAENNKVMPDTVCQNGAIHKSSQTKGATSGEVCI